MINIKLFLEMKDIPVKIDVVRNTNSIPISFHIMDYQIPGGAEARIYLRKPSGAEVYNSAEIDENVVIVRPTMQMYAEEGGSIGQLQIVKDTTIAASFAILFCVNKNIISDSAIESTNEFGILDALINQAREEIEAAQNATSEANTAAESATTAANSANVAASRAATNADLAMNAAISALDSSEAATSAATSANTAADRANEAAGNIEQASINPLAYSVSGKNIAAINSAEKPLIGLTVHGRSDQVSTTGAQLIDFEHAPTRSCVLVDASTGTYRCNMNNTSYSFLDLPTSVFGKILSGKGKTLRFQCDASKPNTLISIVIYGTREDGLDYQDAVGTPGSNYLEMIVSDQFTSITRAVLRFNQTQGATTTDTTTIYSGLMLYFRESAALPFEPYTGGAPSPSVEYPQAIDIAGSGGSISINLMGYNLWDGTEQEDVTGYTTGMIPWDGGDRVHILFDGNTDNADGELVCSIDYYEQVGKKVGANAMSVKTGTTYTKVKFTATGINAGGIGKNVDIKTVKYIVVAIKPFNNTATKISFKNVVISSSADTVFVGYTPSILNVIATPNGLPAVPVSAGGNYTDENGQQWICDEIVRNERGTGKRIQRIGIIESYASETINTAYMSTTGQLTEGATVLYVLDDVIETDLSAEEIAALSALHTYSPTTTISNDAGCDMTAAYVTQYYQGVGDAMFYGVADNLTTEASGTSVLDAHQGEILKGLISDIWKTIYPVGSIYMSVNNTDPGTLFGGTWEAWGTGRVPVGVDSGDSDFSTAEKIGGEKTNTHNHYTLFGNDDNALYVASTQYAVRSRVSTLKRGAISLPSHGEGPCREDSTYDESINILQPYVTCYMWKRTA